MMWLRNPEQEQSPYQSVINNALSDETLMKLRAPIRTKYLQLLQKDVKSFNKAFNAILKIAK